MELRRDIAWKKIALNGRALLEDPLHNKGLSFTWKERRELNLHGLLPPKVETIEDQAKRVMWSFERMEDNLEKYQFIMNLADINAQLYYYVLAENVEKMMPIVYTPTVGLACQKFGYVFQMPRGMYITIKDVGRVYQMLKNWPCDDVKALCFTDGERILGLGDLGTFGMGIPIGKLALYTACAGVNPEHLVPVMLDVGTNNKELREDPFYTGIKQERDRSEKYDILVQEFMTACQRRWGPSVLIQFEDFANRNALRLLKKHQANYCTFNDDIQGTACVGVAALFTAMRVAKSKLSEQTIVMFGAGSAGLGIADLICTAMHEDDGVTLEEARSHIWLVDSRGLVVNGRASGGISDTKKPFSHDRMDSFPDGEDWFKDLGEVVKAVKATAIIGVSGQPKVFTEAVCKNITANTDNPIIFPMSNPTHKAECSFADAYKWTGGKVIFASGSPFPEIKDGDKVVKPAQGNNAYIFPGIALGVIATKCINIPDSMFITAAKALANMVSEEMIAAGTLFPPLQDIQKCSKIIACAVGKEAYEKGLATAIQPKNMIDLIESVMFDHKTLPVYSHEGYEGLTKEYTGRSSVVYSGNSIPGL